MGVKLTPLLIPNILDLSSLVGKKLVIDGCNLLFKYITKIRQNGRLIYNEAGDPISHIIGIFYFIINLYERQIRPFFVFDGYPPEEKRSKSPAKISKLVQMWRLYHKQEGNRRNFYNNTLFLYDKVVSDLQDLIRMMGCPVIRGISEGEAQGARLVREGKAYAMFSMDQDSLLFGCPRTIKEVSFKENRCIYYDLKHQLTHNGISRRQLIDIALLIGTDYNDGIKGIGPKKALNHIKEYKCLEELPRNLFKSLCNSFPDCTSALCKVDTEDYDYNSCVHLKNPFNFERLRSLFFSPSTIEANPFLRAPNTKQLIYYLNNKGLSKARIDRGISRLRLAFKGLPYKQSSLLNYV